MLAITFPPGDGWFRGTRDLTGEAGHSAISHIDVNRWSAERWSQTCTIHKHSYSRTGSTISQAALLNAAHMNNKHV